MAYFKLPFQFGSSNLTREQETAALQTNFRLIEQKFNSIDTAISAGDPVMGGDLSGTASAATIKPGVVTTTKLADGAVTDAKVSASAAIAYSKLNLAGSVKDSDLAVPGYTRDQVDNNIEFEIEDHNHDDRYTKPGYMYAKDEVDQRILSAFEEAAADDHDHDGIYQRVGDLFDRDTVENLIEVSIDDHNHDDRYYTQSVQAANILASRDEVDARILSATEPIEAFLYSPKNIGDIQIGEPSDGIGRVLKSRSGVNSWGQVNNTEIASGANIDVAKLAASATAGQVLTTAATGGAYTWDSASALWDTATWDSGSVVWADLQTLNTYSKTEVDARILSMYEDILDIYNGTAVWGP